VLPLNFSRRRDFERVNHGVSVEKLIQSLDPLLVCSEAQFFLLGSAPLWNRGFIDVVNPLVGVQVVVVLRGDFDFGKLTQLSVGISAELSEVGVGIHAEFPRHFANGVYNAAKSFTHFGSSSIIWTG
jgi:hypothetical protein